MISYLRSAHPALKLGIACASFGALAAFGQLGAGAAATSSLAQGNAAVQPGVPQPFRFAPVDPATAERMNAAQPVDASLLAAARPFMLTGAPADRARALKCLTEAVYYEAASEPVEGQRAVAQVVLNRVRHPLFPHSVCGVVYQGASLATGCQFSFVCDGSLQRGHDDAAWAAAGAVARAALNGAVEPAVGEATHYHATYVAPYWAPTVAKVAHIGLHIFYRWSGAMGLPAAFTARYAAVERIPAVRPHAPEAAPLQLAAAPEAELAGAKLDPALAVAASAKPSPTPGDGRVHLVLDADGYAAAPRAAVAVAPPVASRPAALGGAEVGKAAKPADPSAAKPATPATAAATSAAVALIDGVVPARPVV